MRISVGPIALIALLLGFATAPLHAQYQPPSEQLIIKGKSVHRWSNSNGNVVEIQGPLTIELETATLSAKQAVIWLTHQSTGNFGADGRQPMEHAEIVLFGDAQIRQKVGTRSGDRLFVTADVRGTIRLTTDEQIDQPDDRSELYRRAETLRAAALDANNLPPVATAPSSGPTPSPSEPTAAASEPATQPSATGPAQPATAPAVSVPANSARPTTEAATTEPTELSFPGSRPAVDQPETATTKRAAHPKTRPTSRATSRPATQPSTLDFESLNTETVHTPDGNIAVSLSGGVTLLQRRPSGDSLQLRADRVVLFTPFQSMKEVGKGAGVHRLEDAVTGAYLEGDVRISLIPANGKMPEQRLAAERVFYDFLTDRAILTDAVLRTIDAQRGIPVIVRARTIRQLAMGEYTTDKTQLTTSSFAVPTYAIAADRMYVRVDEIPGEFAGERISFRASDATFRVFDHPGFYWPSLSGSVTDRGGPLRGINFNSQDGFGTGVETDWGLFESLGVLPPVDLDVGYQLDYFTERGPALGATAAYRGGFITDGTRQPWEFEGDFKGYAVYDKGDDYLGDSRRNVYPNGDEDPGDHTLRGRFLWEHQHYFPDDWSMQIRVGYTSDATFREEWFLKEFDEDQPLDTSVYLKHQKDTEAFTLLLDADPSRVVTTADLVQEQFEVEKLPEVAYHRIGDGFADNQLTFFSDNSASALHFQKSDATLQEQGYLPGSVITPGLPSLGQTGVPGNTVYRANFRQEVDYPITLDQFRVVPYVMGIYTQYSDSPNNSAVSRVLGGTGLKLTTEYWKVDPTAYSDFFDIHQLRHVIEPELNLFTSAQNIRHDDVYMYDEQIDEVSDISAAQLALHQRWETKRGGPGQWRSVDVFTLNVEIDGFLNKPPARFINPLNFRGLYFPSMPEASVPRDAINADASWRLTDETVLVADASYNIDKKELATAAIGLLVRRGDRISYYIENRYIDLLRSNITSVHLDYELSTKYSVSLDQSFDFTLGKDVSSSVSVLRRFDSVVCAISANHDETTGTNGVSFSISPTGIGRGIGTGAFSNSFHR